MDTEMKMEFSALAENEAFARGAVAAFIMSLDPTVEELTEIKTAVSEAVSNSIIQRYGNMTDRSKAAVTVECRTFYRWKGSDKSRGSGIGDRRCEKSNGASFYHRGRRGTVRNGFYRNGKLYGQA